MHQVNDKICGSGDKKFSSLKTENIE
jgi:hypothetical protein